MGKEYRFITPFGTDDIAKLQIGDMVYIDGEIVITAGLPTHQRIIQYIENGQSLPIDLSNSVFLHMGSYSKEKEGKTEVLYVNPTTSTRFNPYMPTIIRKFRVKAVGGKGGLDKNCVQSMKDTGCVYLSVLGAGCTLFSSQIRDAIAVGWNDLVPHYRLVNLKVEHFGPLIVSIDAHGNSIYEKIDAGIKQRMPAIMRDLSGT